jgi:hypothetical protein
MLAEVRGAKSDLNVEVIGINIADEAEYDSLVAQTRTLPWLQDTSAQNVWGKWGANWRDVKIIDSLGRLWLTYNLFDHDLSFATNYTSLKQKFLQAAVVVDSDRDHLADDWELLHFGNLAANPGDDPDQDGFDNYTEFCFGTDPLDPKSSPALLAKAVAGTPRVALRMTYRCRAGAWLNYLVDQSPDLQQWQDNTAALSRLQQSRNLFDGTGCLEINCSIPTNAFEAMFRVRAAPR